MKKNDYKRLLISFITLSLMVIVLSIVCENERVKINKQQEQIDSLVYIVNCMEANVHPEISND